MLPEDPGLLGRRDRRQAALAAWFRLKVAAPAWGARFEVVSGLDMQMRLTTAAGWVIKVWRPDGENSFRIAGNDQAVPGLIQPEDLLERIVRLEAALDAGAVGPGG
jgi:hypothetical protein